MEYGHCIAVCPRDTVAIDTLDMGEVLELKGISCGIDPIYLSQPFEGTDGLFCHAGTVIMVSSDSPQAAGIASAHMETMVYALGVGMIYSGFTTRAVGHSVKLQEYLGLQEHYKVWTVLVVGYPKVKYQRTVPRKKADAIWD